MSESVSRGFLGRSIALVRLILSRIFVAFASMEPLFSASFPVSFASFAFSSGGRSFSR